MREIKFRGQISKGIANAGQWVYWDLKGTDLIDCVDMETVGQFTGLKDKNGKEIYEGDIVKSHFNGNAYPIVFGSCELHDNRGEGEGFFDGLIWEGMPFGRDIDGNTDHYEVVGNIHENPELLGAA